MFPLDSIYVRLESRKRVGRRWRLAFTALIQSTQKREGLKRRAGPESALSRNGGDGGGHDPLFLTWPFNVRLRHPRPSQPNNTLGKAIRQSRATLGMSQAGLAARLGIDRKTVRSWERGDTVPAGSKIASLGECLQVDLFSLV